MNKITKTWVKITDELLAEKKITKRQLYQNVYNGSWFDGFIIKKGRNSNRWKFFCEEDWLKWEKIENYQAA